MGNSRKKIVNPTIYGEILKKESAAVNTIETRLWEIPQNIVTMHISESMDSTLLRMGL